MEGRIERILPSGKICKKKISVDTYGCRIKLTPLSAQVGYHLCKAPSAPLQL